MFIIRKESNEYVNNGVYCSYETIKFFNIPIYIKIFTTTNETVLQQFSEIPENDDEREYKDPVVVKGFTKE